MMKDGSCSKKGTVLELLLIVAFFSTFVLTITVGFGPMFSGWHLVDDHQFFGYIARFRYNHESVFSVMLSEVKRDFFQQHRARFLYYPFRVLQTYLFGYNSVAYCIVKAIEGIIALSFLYYVGRQLNVGRYLSIIFAIVVLAGYQGAVLWKLGPQHLQSTMFMASGLYYMMRYLKNRKKASLIASIVLFFLMTCFHESFVVTIPFLVLFVIFYELHSEDYDGTISIEKLLGILKKDSKLIIPLCVVFVVVMAYIVCLLGIFSYGVVKKDVAISSILSNLKSGFVLGDFGYYFGFGTALLIILASYYEKIKPVWMAVLLAFTYALPQIMLYTSEPFYERYLLPLTLGWALLFVANYGIRVVEGFRKVAYTVLLTAMTLLLVRTTIVEADYYRFRGDSVTPMLETTLELSRNGYNVVSILGIANPEADMTMSAYLRSYGEANCWYWHEKTKTIKNNPPYNGDGGDEVHSVSDVDLFVAYNRDDRHFTMDPTLDLSGFHKIKCGSLDLFFSDRAYAALSDEEIARFKVKPTIYGIGAGN